MFRKFFILIFSNSHVLLGFINKKKNTIHFTVKNKSKNNFYIKLTEVHIFSH
jgi:hypothetical protein